MEKGNTNQFSLLEMSSKHLSGFILVLIGDNGEFTVWDAIRINKIIIMLHRGIVSLKFYALCYLKEHPQHSGR